MKKKPAIGVCDLGASGGRIFITFIQDDSLKVREVYRFTHTQQSYFQPDPQNGKSAERFSWDFDLIYSEILNGLRNIAQIDDIELKSFGVDTWGSDGSWINDVGEMLCPVPTGRDSRWQQARQEIFDKIDAEELFRLTGVQSHPFNVLNQIYWYAHYNPELVNRASTYLPVNSLLYYFLTGRKVAEYTWMSTTQLCKAVKAEYEESIFELLGLPLEKMPKIVMPGTSLGTCHKEFAERLGLEQFEVIVPATHDTACAYAAADVTTGRNTFVISTGTWFLAGMKVTEPIFSKEAFESGFANEGGYGEVRFLTNIMGSWPAQQLRRLWSQQDNKEMSWEKFCELTKQGTAFNCVLDIDSPLFFDASDMEEAVRKYCLDTKQNPPRCRGDFARAVYEALALKVALTAEKLAQLTGKSIDEILILGGISHDLFLNQFFADASGLTVRAGPADATAYGNALIQAISLGWIDSVEKGLSMLRANYTEKIFEPNPNEDWNQAKRKLKERYQQ